MNHFLTMWPPALPFRRSPALIEDAADVRSWCLKDQAGSRLVASRDRFSFTEEDRRAHCRRSLQATFITLAAGVGLIAVFFGIVAALGGH